MRRPIATIAVFGLVLAGLGCCHHIAGKHDCGYNAADAVITGPTAPYPTTPAPGIKSTELMPVPTPPKTGTGN